MGLASDFRDFFNTSKKIATDGYDIFKPIDVDKYKKELSVEDRALSDGAAGLPDTRDLNLSSTELSIANSIEAVKTDYLNQYNANQRSYGERVAGFVSNWSIDKVKNEERALVSSVVETAKLAVDQRFESEKAMKAISNEIVLFRRSNSLMHRTPNVKSIGHFMLAMTALFAAELAVSIFLLRETGNLQTVVMWAFSYSLCNSLIPYYLGSTAVRWSFLNNNPIKRNFGVIAAIGALIAGVALNFFVGTLQSCWFAFKRAGRGTFVR